MGDHLVQLGTVHLRSTDPIASTSTGSLEDILRSTDWDLEYQSVASTLSYVLSDAGLGAHLELDYEGVEAVVRVGILPSDRKGSLWKRHHSPKREYHLSRLFQHLRTGWTSHKGSIHGVVEENDYLMARTVRNQICRPRKSRADRSQAADEQKIDDLYASIPSPPEPNFDGKARTAMDREIQGRLERYEFLDNVKTPLYDYQFRSVARMLQMETSPGRMVDPYFIPLDEAGREGRYHLNTTTWDIQSHPGWYDLPRGGILCEQMGVGKTLMCLSLVVATLHTPPQPPDNTLDCSPALTEHTLRTYPFAEHREARSRLEMAEPGLMPSLSDLCATVLSNHDHSARKLETVPITQLKQLGLPRFYYIYPRDDPCEREAKRKQRQITVTKMYLANTTLIVVPLILLQQWKFEIAKHIEAGTMSVLEIGKGDIPPVHDLIKYDVILVDVNRFGQEETVHRMELQKDPSELTKARWKRIILDEGHAAGEKTSNAMRLAINLSVERRWIVSGTPTKHLQQGGEVEKAPKSRSRPRANPLSWSKWDLDDATRIGVMIGGFLGAEPFRSEATFQHRVTSLLRGRDGPKFGAVRRLRYLMSEMMVKHAPRVIDAEAQLPPLTITHEVVPFHPMQRISYNVIMALITSNVFTSAFEDPDYLLHESRVKEYRAVIANIHLATFWYSAREIGVAECLERTKEHLLLNRIITPQGRIGLEEACEYLQRALDTPGWQEWMDNGISLPYEVDTVSIPHLIRDSWSDSMDTDPSVIDAKSLQSLRELNRPGKTLQQLHLVGWEHRAYKHPERLEDMQKAEQRAGKLAKQTVAHAPPSVRRAPVKRSKKTTLDLALDEAARNAAKATRIDDHLEPSHPLPSTLRLTSRSAKTNRLISIILSSAPDDKFVIFGDNLELGHVTESLDLFDIKSCFAGGTVSANTRFKVLEQFKSPATKVCLLDLKIGARGLNLVTANRMIFLAPVWNLDVQAQAVKRIHRIGQTRPTTVQILVAQDTFEEDIAKRTSASRSDTEEQLYSRTLIENPRFVKVESNETTPFTIRFGPEAPIPTTPRLTNPDVLDSAGTSLSGEHLVTPNAPSEHPTLTIRSPGSPCPQGQSRQVIHDPIGQTTPTPIPTSASPAHQPGEHVAPTSIRPAKRAAKEDKERPKKRSKVAFA